ncbi:MAG: tetratricopeptide repeat protein [bacterium]|nr:tetratricopeptide repeat protein [bacterium]
MKKIWILIIVLIAGTVAFQYFIHARRPAGDPGNLRRMGNFKEAERSARIKYKETKDPAYLEMQLGIIEDTGDSKRLIKAARQSIKDYPDNNSFKWCLARALLFAAATFPNDKQFGEWVDEAESITSELEKNNFTAPEVPGAIAVLKTEIAFLRQNWTEADKYAAQALEEGTTAGETGDLYQLRCDIAFREGRTEDAVNFLDKALESVEEAAGSSYYGLRSFREEALGIKDILFDIPFTEAQVDELVRIHNDLLQKGFVDPTVIDDSEHESTIQFMRVFITYRKQKNYEGILEILEGAINSPDAHTPRCFFSEAVDHPFRLNALYFGAGKTAMAMKNYDKAEHYFEEALKIHPKDKNVEQKLQETRNLKNKN